jgi:hypothetical protein
LTRLVPFETVDEVLAATGRLQQRLRLLPARVVVYLLLAGCLFAELGYPQVWQQLTTGLSGLGLAEPTSSALRQARQRLEPAPLRALFDLLRGPARHHRHTGRAVAGLLLTAIDGWWARNSSGGWPALAADNLLRAGDPDRRGHDERGVVDVTRPNGMPYQIRGSRPFTGPSTQDTPPYG